ncbi:MAG: Na+/H+ antiporter NhaA [Myxococcota bacterium]|nr:Na+/H+ antiporter NhaA [Myxococcota bacterium]
MSHTPRRSTLHILQEFSIPLLAGVPVALILANWAPHTYETLIHGSPFGAGSHLNLHFLVNDVLMVLFFGLATKEIVESVLPGGALNPPRKAINPILATLGGVFGPIAVYFGYVAFTGETSIARGWGIPTATDIALAWLVARLIFGAGHPAVSFLLLLAIVDDGIGLGIIAIFYPDPAHPVAPAWLGLVAVAAASAWGLRRANVQSFWPYVVVCGGISWVGLHSAHLHPALALVAVVPFMPSAQMDVGLFAEESDGQPHDDTLNRFEHFFKLPVDLCLFFFALANAGVVFSSVGPATTAVLLGLVAGKTIGVFAMGGLGVLLGFPLPTGVSLRSLAVIGLVSGIGLTVALFVSGVAFTDPTLQGAAKMGALLSAAVAPLAVVVARLLRVRSATWRRPADDEELGYRPA